jgi:predicted ArsR family transcriptional regulator
MYPNEPGWKGKSSTGRQAAHAFAPKAKSIRVRALEVIQRGPATAEQVAEQLDLYWMIVRARLSELGNQGLIQDSGARGTGALGGKVIIWRLATEEERAVFTASQGAEAEKEPHQ